VLDHLANNSPSLMQRFGIGSLHDIKSYLRLKVCVLSTKDTIFNQCVHRGFLIFCVQLQIAAIFSWKL